MEIRRAGFSFCRARILAATAELSALGSIDPTEALLKSLFQNLANPRGFAQTVIDAEARRQLAATSRQGDPKETASALWRAIPGLPLIVSRDAFVKFFMGQGADAKNAVSGLASSAAPAPTEP